MIALLLATSFLQTSPQWQLRTGDTEATVLVENERPVLADLRNARDKHVWLSHSEVPLIDHIWLDGRLTPIQWRFASGTQEGSELRLQFTSDTPRMDLDSIWRARPGAGPIEHRIEIKNRTSRSVTAPEQDSLSLSGIDPGGDSQVWWERRGASNALTEGGVFQEAVRSGMSLDLVSDHHNPRSPVPWLSVQVGDRRGLYVGWEFSGLGHVTATATGATDLTVRAGLMPDFKTDVHAGETLRVPCAFVGCYSGDMDVEAAKLGAFVREKLRAKPARGFADPCTVVNEYIDAGGGDAKESDVLRCLRFAHSLGFDAFMCDAMWFPACGDWRWDPKRFPNGGTPISDTAHRDGMKFGLWCAWDNGGTSADPSALSVRGPNGHPDWFNENLPANWQPGPYYGVTACMADNDARKWAIAKTQQVVGQSHVDLFKTDVHPMVNACVQTDHRHGYGTDVGYWSCLGVYEVWDRLRRRYPGLVLENCSGASHIKDFGVVQECAYTVVTDTLSNLPDRAGIYDSTYILPPSALMTYTYENGYGLPGDQPDKYLFRSAMATAWQLAPTNSAKWSQKSRQAAIDCIKTYKEWLRPILADCEVHHVLPRPDGKHWDGMFYWSPKLRKGALFVFRPDSGESDHAVRWAGLDPTRKYQVWCEDGGIAPGVYSGRSLMEEGLPVHLGDRYSSDLLHIQDAALPAHRPNLR